MRKPEPLSTAIERLYRAFSKYQTTPELSSRLPAKALRELTANDFASSGIGNPSQLSAADLKHLLPRIFELLIHGQWLTRPEVVTSSLARTDWRRWQKNEQNAVEKFLFAGWCYLISEPVCVERIDRWLCASMQVLDAAYMFISELGNEWWIQPLPKAAHLARLILLNQHLLPQDRLSNPYWSGREKQMRKAARWLTSDFYIWDLDEIVDEHPYEPVADELRKAAFALAEMLFIEHQNRERPPLPDPKDFVRDSTARMGRSLPNDEVTQAIAHLYEVFAPYQRSGEAQAVVGTKPLDELAEDDLYQPTRDIILTWGTAQDMKHLLPRILELALEPGWRLRPEGIFFKMILADYHMWPKTERDAIEALVTAVWPVLLGDPDYPVSAEEWLCGASWVVKDLVDMPVLWRRLCCEGSTPAIIHWARFADANCESLQSERKLTNPFCAKRTRELVGPVNWVLSAPSVAYYIRSKGGADELPDELLEALVRVKSVWEKGGGAWSVTNIAFHDPGRALDLAHRQDVPYRRCFGLASISQSILDEDIRETALRESFAAGAEAGEPHRVVEASSRPLGVLIELGQFEWARKETARLIHVIRHETNPYRCIDALNKLMKPSFYASPELYGSVLNEIGKAAEEAYGWQAAYLLMIGSETADEFDHAGAVHIALMIRNLRTRRRALRKIGESELAEQQY